MKKAFVRSVATLSLGWVIASALAIISEPWISRYWTPQLFGVVSYYNSVIVVLSTSIFLRYDFSIVQARTDTDAHGLLHLSLLVGTATMICAGILYSILDLSLGKALPAPLILIAVVFAAMSVLFRFWFGRKADFLQVSLSLLLPQVAFTTLMLLVPLFGSTTESSIVAVRTLSYVLGPIVMVALFFRRDLSASLRVFNLPRMIALARKYRRYPLYEYWGFMAAIVAMNVPLLFIARYWGQETNGLYAKAFYLLLLGVLGIGESVGRVLHQEAAERINHREHLGDFVQSTMIGLLRIALFPFLLVVLVGPELFSYALGNRWELSGHFARHLSLWMLPLLLNTAVRPLFGLLDRQLQFTVIAIATLALRIALLMILGAIQYDILFTIVCLSILNSALMIVQLWYILRTAGVLMTGVCRQAARTLFQLTPLAIVITVGRQFLGGRDELLLLITLAASLPYGYVYYLRNSFVKEILPGRPHPKASL